MRRIAIGLSVLGIFAVSPALYAEAPAPIRCSSSVSYKWKKEGAPELSIHWAAIEVAAADEEAAKAKLANELNREKKRASEACRALHENSSGCLASKLTAAKDQMASLDFAARKALLDAVNEDCKLQQGKCLETVASEPACIGKKPEEEAAAGGKKEEKGKEKKK